LKLGLGTAQFGLDYGITNKAGKVCSTDIVEILKVAKACNMEIVDTAAAYGDSEKVLGQTIDSEDYFKIVTKTPRIGHDTITQHDTRRVREGFMNSLSQLKRSRVYGLLVHSAQDLIACDAERLADELRCLQSEGLVDRIGVSVYSGEEIDQIIARHEIDLIQVPVNVFDQRLVASGHLSLLRERGIEIHARSVFLQGLLLLEPSELPEQFAALRRPLEDYSQFLDENGISKIEGAIEFLNETGCLDHAIVGVLSAGNLLDISNALSVPKARKLDFSRFALSDRKVIDPTLWNQSRH
jgi:aryl-alcohol dehydrogenase-like predicted oxidoreductase